MVQRYIKELDTEHTGSYTTATELANLNDMRVHCQGSSQDHSLKFSQSSKLSEFVTYE